RLLLGRELGRADHQPELAVSAASVAHPGLAAGGLGEGGRRGGSQEQRAHDDRGEALLRPRHGSSPVRVLSTSRAMPSRVSGPSSAVARTGSPFTEKSDAETSERIAATPLRRLGGGPA